MSRILAIAIVLFNARELQFVFIVEETWIKDGSF